MIQKSTNSESYKENAFKIHISLGRKRAFTEATLLLTNRLLGCCNALAVLPSQLPLSPKRGKSPVPYGMHRVDIWNRSFSAYRHILEKRAPRIQTVAVDGPILRTHFP